MTFDVRKFRVCPEIWSTFFDRYSVDGHSHKGDEVGVSVKSDTLITGLTDRQT